AKDKKLATPIYLQDVMPTSLELAGVEKPEYVEFQSLVPVLGGTKKHAYDAIYGAYVNVQRMITVGDHKLIRYPKIDKTLLFDLAADPWETKDLAADPAYAERVAALSAQLEKLKREMNDPLASAD
ncbi:MAG: DUF4976 domain-containing protein, partial [Pirellulales bacterium]|nr:DUF4976 domain-containing protein [Pirellulales bacterium]